MKKLKWNRPSANLVEQIKERDNYTCAFTLMGICAGFCSKELHVHHIHPFGANKKWDNFNNPNRDGNLITLCFNGHARIHDNLLEMQNRTPEGLKTFQEMMRLNKLGKKYWNDEFDERLKQQAIENRLDKMARDREEKLDTAAD